MQHQFCDIFMQQMVLGKLGTHKHKKIFVTLTVYCMQKKIQNG